MNIERMRLASLSSNDLEKVQGLENELGYLLLALEPKHPLADLDSEQIAKLKKLEEEIGVVLLAYNS